MQMEPGFSFKKEFPKLDKALNFIGPYLAAVTSALIVMFIQSILPIHLIWMALLKLANVNPGHGFYIFPAVAAIVTLYLDHERRKNHTNASSKTAVP